MRAATAPFGLWSGVGLVVANMVGAGVFLSAGFMARELGPTAILFAWVVGAGLALCGALAYAELARRLPRSGGEYRFLHERAHPALGYLAGWASLLLGFSAPVAVNALGAGHYAATLAPALPPRGVAVALIVALTLAHAAGLRQSATAQNALVAVKALLLVAFVATGLALGRSAWPAWTPPAPPAGGPLPAFATGLFFIAFAFSGWNAAAYVAEEFRDPRRQVPQAMLVGCALVGLLYLAINWILVANLTPRDAAQALADESGQATLGHLAMERVLGPPGARWMSGIILVAFVSSISAMTVAGPRVYAAMARDGFLPAPLAGRPGAPPVGSVLLQGGIALALTATTDLREALVALGGLLTLFSALTVATLLRRRGDEPLPPVASRAAACVYAAASVALLVHGFRASPTLVGWVALCAVAGLAGYAAARRRARG